MRGRPAAMGGLLLKNVAPCYVATVATLAGLPRRTPVSERTETAASLADPGSFHARDTDLRTSDPLKFADYADALAHASENSGSDESVVAGEATIGGTSVELASFDFGCLGGSMGEVAGERLARSLERAAERQGP